MTFSVNKNGAGAQTTAGLGIAFTASDLQTALENLSNVDPGDVTVTGGPFPNGTFTITYNTIGDFLTVVAGSGYNNAPTLTMTTVWTGRAPDTTYYLPALAEVNAQVALYPNVKWIFSLVVGTNDGGTPIPGVDYGRYILSGAQGIVAAGHKLAVIAPPYLRTSNGNIVANMAAMNQYPIELAAMHDGNNIYYGGDLLLRQTIRNPWGSTDGLHAVAAGDEDNLQKQVAADTIINMLLPNVRIIGG